MSGISQRRHARRVVRALRIATLMLLAACNRAAPAAAVPAALIAETAQEAAASIRTTRSDFTATLRAGQPIDIDNPYGDVHVRFGGFEHKVDGHAVMQEPVGAAAIALHPAATEDGSYRIDPRLPQGTSLLGSQRVDLSIFVPEGHALRVHTGQGQIDVRGVHGDVDLKSTGGDITLRAIKGAVRAETGGGAIEASLGTAPRHASQRLATNTGTLLVGVDDHLDAALDLATSALFATDYSLEVTRRPGQEPNKRARTVIGQNTSKLVLESRQGEIRLIRRASFTAVGGAPEASDAQTEQDSDSD